VVTGDIVYDEVYPWTAETTPEQRKAWAVTLDKLSALKPERVVPGHQKSERTLDASSIQFTKDYLAAYDEALAGSKNAKQLEATMKTKYPNAALPVIVKIGAEAAFKSGGKSMTTDGTRPTDGSQPKTRTQPGSNTQRQSP
ncbi:MAG TPA: hypothetical protein VMS65_01785, partial [Polyangiaceae bacterium]|nr:hypothetical protein [Polyangiaceae bacterium]